MTEIFKGVCPEVITLTGSKIIALKKSKGLCRKKRTLQVYFLSFHEHFSLRLAFCDIINKEIPVVPHVVKP